MTANSAILIILGVIAVYALLSRKIENSILTMPIIFTGLGFGLGHMGLGLLPMEIGQGWIHLIAEITLIIVLFADASSVKLNTLKHNFSIPARMLFIGMPLGIAIGWAVAYWVSPEQPWTFALLVAAILTPTDAALAQSVLTNKNVPERIRESLNVESGLNDGLALPVVLVAAIFTVGATGMSGDHVPDNIPLFVILQVTLGPLVGAGIGFIAAKMLDLSVSRKASTTIAQGLYFLSIALLAYFVAEAVGGNGFIAAFIAGLTFGNVLKSSAIFIREFVEGDGQILTLLTFLIFGAVLAPMGLEHFGPKTVILALAFLTIVRLTAIWISLLGSGLSHYEKFFLGWFGPRGLASILFALLVLERFDIPGSDEMAACIVLTVMFSIVLHGVSAAFLSNRFKPKDG